VGVGAALAEGVVAGTADGVTDGEADADALGVTVAPETGADVLGGVWVADEHAVMITSTPKKADARRMRRID
jgi:hypothetical protein